MNNGIIKSWLRFTYIIILRLCFIFHFKTYLALHSFGSSQGPSFWPCFIDFDFIWLLLLFILFCFVRGMEELSSMVMREADFILDSGTSGMLPVLFVSTFQNAFLRLNNPAPELDDSLMLKLIIGDCDVGLRLRVFPPLIAEKQMMS